MQKNTEHATGSRRPTVPLGEAESFSQAVARTNDWYQQREQDPAIGLRWAPFQEAEVAGRCQQYRQLARLLRNCDISSLKGKRVLDVGCGTGRQVRTFLDCGADPAQVCGIDIRSSVLDEGRRLSPHLRFELFDGIRIPFDDEAFDLVTQFVCFSSIPSHDLRRHLAREMWRVLAPGGYLFWWDLLYTQGPSERDRNHPLDLGELLPGQPREEHRIGALPGPDECLGTFRGAWLLRPLLRRLRQKPLYCAALVGPK